ncbi:hypothetical protein Hdeb2414_s0012g00388131 [Helianthus debilis subsp. tardiflorus]
MTTLLRQFVAMVKARCELYGKPASFTLRKTMCRYMILAPPWRDFSFFLS